MNSNTSYPWHRAVQDAVDENNTNQIETKIQLAEFVIFERIDLFLRKDYGEEEEALFDALVTLRLLKYAALVDSLGTGTEVATPTEPSAGKYLGQRVFSYPKSASKLRDAGSFSGVSRCWTKVFGPKSKSVMSTCDYFQSKMHREFRHLFTMSPQRIGSHLPSSWMISSKERTERQHMRGRICTKQDT